MNYGKDFRNYALSSGLTSMNLHYFEKMSDGQFMEYWGRKIREAGDRMVRRIIRQYTNKEKED